MDVGGTRIKAGVFDDRGELRALMERDTPVQLGRDGILACITELIGSLMAVHDGPIRALGVGTAGRVDSESGKIAYATDNLPGWMGTPLKEQLAARFGLPVAVDNDVNAAALGEGWLGAGAGAGAEAGARARAEVGAEAGAAMGKGHFMLVALGTGVGGALVHNMQIISGSQGGAGEVGHMILHPRGRVCNCGQRGCWERYVSGSALNQLAYGIDRSWDSRELLKQAEQREPRAEAALRGFVDELSMGLVSLQNMYDPDIIILGGGVADSYPQWSSQLRDRIKEHTPRVVRIAPALLGNQAGMLGAARRALDLIGR